MLSDLRYAIRTLARSPGFAAVAILTLALGIGANAAIFAVFNGILLHPLPYPDPARLAAVQEVVPKFAKLGDTLPVNAMHFQQWRDHNHSFSDLALLNSLSFNLTTGGEPERVSGARVSASLFPLLGIRAALGRTFFPDEDQPGHDLVAVISDSLFTRRFHRDPAILGQTIVLDSKPYQVIGVLPPSARVPTDDQLYSLSRAPEDEEIWKPFAISDDDLTPMGDFDYGCIVRLKSGASLASAAADLEVLQHQIGASLADPTELHANLALLQERIIGSSRSSLTLLLAAAAAVLLIVVVNLANLQFARSAGRRRELAIRAAIGASLARLVRQLLTESLLLAAAGGILGAIAAQWALAAIVLKAPLDLPGIRYVHMDPAVFAFLALISLSSGILFGVLPAWRTAHADPQAALHTTGRTTAGRRAGRTRSVLIAAEVALSALCLIAGGLLLNSFVRLLHVDTGFQADHAMALGLGLPAARYPDLETRGRFVHTMLDRVEALPGVVAAGISNRGPLSGVGSNLGIWVEGVDIPAMERPSVDYRCISPDYFPAIGIPLVSGRLVAEQDRGRRVADISARAAARLWPGQNPIGRRFQLGGGDNFHTDRDAWVTIVGVVGDVRYSINQDPNLTVYLPYWQRDRSDFALIVRTAMDPGALTPALRTTLRALDPQLVVPRPLTLGEVVDASVRPRRFQLALVLAFAISALLLAAIGVYGVVSQSVTQRTRELGIRLALGAPHRDLWMVIARQGLAPVCAGLVAGLAAALASAHLLTSLLYGVPATDPLTYVMVAAVLIGAALLACSLPARRATRIDPLDALRQE